jgi:arginase
MSITFVVVPQWQGSGSPRRLQISGGAAAIRAGLPAAQVTDVEVPGEPGAGVRGYRVLREIHDRHARRLADTDAGITEFTPWSVAETAGDLATIRQILGALTG